jgi:hypothetical protein
VIVWSVMLALVALVALEINQELHADLLTSPWTACRRSIRRLKGIGRVRTRNAWRIRPLSDSAHQKAGGGKQDGRERSASSHRDNRGRQRPPAELRISCGG